MAPDFRKGNPPIGGTDFEVQLQTLFALGGLLHFKNENWKLANEHEEAGKFDDLVFQTDLGDVLLQAKHKQKGKIRENNFLSTNPDNDDFSLPKYILSYKCIKTFDIKYLMLVTNSEINGLIEEPVEEHEMISKIFQNCKIYKIPKSFITILEEKIVDYKQNLKSKQKLKHVQVDEHDIIKFIEKFVCVTIKDGMLNTVIRRRLDTLKKENAIPVASYKYVVDQIKEWYKSKASKACFMNKHYITSILYGEQNQLEIDNFLDESLLFTENYPFNNITLITIDKFSDLKIKKVVQSLWAPYKKQGKLKENFYNNTLFLNGEHSICKDMIECFSIDKFNFLVILCRGIMKREIENIYQKVYEILSEFPQGNNKKVIFLCEKQYLNINPLVDTISYKSFQPETQVRLWKKNIIFQGKSMKLEDICCQNHDIIENCNEATIATLMGSGKYIIGSNVNKNDIKSYYIERTLNNRNELISEQNILNQCYEKVLVIYDQPGSGKSTLLLKLAKLWKDQFPNEWIIHLDPNIIINQMEINYNSLIDVINSQIKTSDDFQKNLLCVLNKYILIDGLDEISPTDRKRLLLFIKEISSLRDVVRIIVATRSYSFILDEIVTIDNVAILTLQEFAKREQIEFLKKYFKHGMNIDIENADMFVQTLPEVLKHFLSIPLYLEMTADVFTDHVSRNKLLENNFALVSNTNELFNLFIARKKQQFIEYKCSCVDNSVLKNILSDCFDRYLEELEPLAVRNNFHDPTILKEFKIDTYRIFKETVLHTGMLIKVKEDFIFTHKTFEEYFTARFIWRVISQANVSEKIISVMCSNVFMNPEKQNICHFLDCMLETEDLNKYKDLSITIGEIIGRNEKKNLLNLASQGSVYILKLLFTECEKFSTFVDYKGTHNETALLLAAHHLPTIKYLVKNGADIYAEDTDGFSVLHYAVTKFSSFDNFKVQHSAISKSLLYRKMMSHMKSAQQNVYRYTELENYMKTIAKDYQKSVILHRHADNFNEIIEYFVSLGINLDLQTKLGITVLHYIAYCGLYKEFRYVHKLGASLDIKDIYGNNIMHYAVLGGSIEIVKYLNTFKSLSTTNKYGSAPIHFTPIGNSIDVANFFISKNINIESEDKYGRTVLFYINSVTTMELVDLFVKFKIDLKKKSTDIGYNILHMSAFTNAVEIVKYLIDEWSELYIGDKIGQFPEHYAAEGDSVNVLKLFRNVLDIPITKKVDNNGCTILHLASIGDSINTVKYLVTQLDMEPTIPDFFDKSPLQYAACNGAIRVLQFYKTHGVDFNKVDEERATLLHYASKHNSVNTFKYLHINCNLNINQTDRSGKHVIHYAAENDSLNILKYLLEIGISPTVTDLEGDTILHRSAFGNAMSTTDYIFKNLSKLYVPNNNNHFPVHHAVAGDSIDVVKYFSDNGVDFDILLKKNVSLLHIASIRSFRVFKFLIEKRIMNPTLVDKDNQCCVHYASENDNIHVVKYLMKRNKAYFELVNKDGANAMHLAALGNAIKTLEYLDECGISIVDREKNGMIPLHYACKGDALDAIKYFFRKKVNMYCLDYRKNSVLHWCAVGNAMKAFKFLIQNCHYEQIIDQLNINEEQPLHIAIQFDSLEIFIQIFLISQNDLLLHFDTKLNSLLHYAVKHDSIRVIKFLVEELNMPTNQMNTLGKTPIDFAKQYKSEKALKYFNLSVNKKTCSIS